MTLTRWIIVASLSGVLAGCQQPSSSVEEQEPVKSGSQDYPTELSEDAKQQAVAAKNALFERLSSRLMAIVSSDGPLAAIEVCSQEAPLIAETVGAEHGVEIGRTSFKLRNPDNTAPDWATPFIEQRLDEPRFVALPDNKIGALLPIKLQAQCLICHGPSDDLADDLKTKLSELYPDDQATGFEEGELRGWFWVVVSTPESPSLGKSNDSDEQTFARFDEVYIPALALTKQEKSGPSQIALAQLAQRWQQIRPDLSDILAEDSNWAHDLETTDQAITEAVRLAREDQLAKAHETLEVIRDLMMEARRREQFSYPLDALSDFHATMEEIVKPSVNLSPETITDEFVQQLRALSQVADEKWKKVEATKFNLDVFGIDATAAPQLQAFIAEVRNAIEDLEGALSSGDKPAIIQSARALKPLFAKAYMFFGDFPSPAAIQDNRGGSE